MTDARQQLYDYVAEMERAATEKRNALGLNRGAAEQREYWYFTGQIEACLEIKIAIRGGK
jgi:hypothetical protein